MLVKLKTECGYQFTSKLESMFTDIKTSRDTMQEYKSHLQAQVAQESDVDLSVQARLLRGNLVPKPAYKLQLCGTGHCDIWKLCKDIYWGGAAICSSAKRSTIFKCMP